MFDWVKCARDCLKSSVMQSQVLKKMKCSGGGSAALMSRQSMSRERKAEWWRATAGGAANVWRKVGPRGAERNSLGRCFRTSLAALLSKARYLLFRFIGELQGGAALIRQQSMGGERGVQEGRNGFGLGGAFAPHWRALSARARYLLSHLIGCALSERGGHGGGLRA